MKVLRFLLIGWLAGSLSATAQVKFSTTLQQLGTIPEDTVHLPAVCFRYTNIGKTVTSVSRVSTSCGCLKVSYSSRPLSPGKSDSIRITFDPAGHPGVFDRKVTIYFSRSSKPYMLRLTGVVRAAVRRKF